MNVNDVTEQLVRKLEAAQEAVVLMYEHLIPLGHREPCLDCDRVFRDAGVEPDSPRDPDRETAMLIAAAHLERRWREKGATA